MAGQGGRLFGRGRRHLALHSGCFGLRPASASAAFNLAGTGLGAPGRYFGRLSSKRRCRRSASPSAPAGSPPAKPQAPSAFAVRRRSVRSRRILSAKTSRGTPKCAAMSAYRQPSTIRHSSNARSSAADPGGGREGGHFPWLASGRFSDHQDQRLDRPRDRRSPGRRGLAFRMYFSFPPTSSGPRNTWNHVQAQLNDPEVPRLGIYW